MCCHPGGLKDQDPKTESGFSPKIMQIRCKPAGLEDRDRKTESGFSPKIMRTYTVNQVVWRIRIPKLNLDLVPKSCKNTQNQVVWRIRIRKVRFPKLILHRGLEAFVDICLILCFWRIRIRKAESRFSPKIMQIRCKATGLEDKDPKPESGFSPKIMQKTLKTR